MKKRSGNTSTRRQGGAFGGPVLWRRLGTIAVIAVPVLFFLPGIGFDAMHPASLARQSAGQSVWYYRVRQDDVLTKIAERELGTLRRAREIQTLNPDIEPRSLTVGSVLKMPPRRKTAATALAGGRAAPQPTAPSTGATLAPESGAGSPRRLLLAFAGLLGLVVLVVAVASHLERRAARA